MPENESTWYEPQARQKFKVEGSTLHKYLMIEIEDDRPKNVRHTLIRFRFFLLSFTTPCPVYPCPLVSKESPKSFLSRPFARGCFRNVVCLPLGQAICKAKKSQRNGGSRYWYPQGSGPHRDRRQHILRRTTHKIVREYTYYRARDALRRACWGRPAIQSYVSREGTIAGLRHKPIALAGIREYSWGSIRGQPHGATHGQHQRGWGSTAPVATPSTNTILLSCWSEYQMICGSIFIQLWWEV